MKNIILTQQEINHKTKRIAYQIYETFADEQEVVLAGIAANGYIFAQKIARELKQISDLNIVLCEVKINKTQPSSCLTFVRWWPVTSGRPSSVLGCVYRIG